MPARRRLLDSQPPLQLSNKSIRSLLMFRGVVVLGEVWPGWSRCFLFVKFAAQSPRVTS